MKKIFAVIPFLFLTGCTCNMPRIVHVAPPDCQKGLPNFRQYVEKSLLESERGIWIVDLDMFYNDDLQTCIGKYVAYRKEGREDDMTLFSIRNIRKNEDIYYEKYTGASLVHEREGQKIYQEKIVALKGT